MSGNKRSEYELKNNKAVTAEILRIKELVEESFQVIIEPNCFMESGKNSDGTWKHGEVLISYATKGNSKLTAFLETEGYVCVRKKIRDEKNLYSNYVMTTVATKWVELIY